MSKDKEILAHLAQGESQRHIAAALHVSRNTVAKVAAAAKQRSLPPTEWKNLAESELHQKLFPASISEPVPVMPDFRYIHRELLRSGVTLKLLWEEYVDRCRQSHQLYFRYSQFCKRYRDHVEQNNLTMHIRHKPGDRIMVDWTGTKIPLGNPASSKRCSAYLFVAVLPFSMYCYAEAMPDMKLPSWIKAHVHAFQFFGGVSRILVCDNLKTGVTKNSKYGDPVLNATYKEMAEHYHTALLPARVLAPRDKAAVEGTVGDLTTSIIAKLRNDTFLTLHDLNRAIARQLRTFNERPFEKREGPRSSVFQEEETPFLHPLPAVPFEYAEWKTVTVGLDYHICIDHQYYSVPFQLVHKRVEARITSTLVEVYYRKERVAIHQRLFGRRHQYTTLPEHMPPNHQLYSLWDGNRFRRWAEKIGPAIKTVIEARLHAYEVEEQAYKSCIAILKLAEIYTDKRLETACKLALQKDSAPSYSYLKNILAQNLDKEAEQPPKPRKAHAFLRGAAYYGGGSHEE